MHSKLNKCVHFGAKETTSKTKQKKLQSQPQTGKKGKASQDSKKNSQNPKIQKTPFSTIRLIVREELLLKGRGASDGTSTKNILTTNARSREHKQNLQATRCIRNSANVSALGQKKLLPRQNRRSCNCNHRQAKKAKHPRIPRKILKNPKIQKTPFSTIRSIVREELLLKGRGASDGTSTKNILDNKCRISQTQTKPTSNKMHSKCCQCPTLPW